MADLRGCEGRAPPPGGPNSFPPGSWRPLLGEILDPPLQLDHGMFDRNGNITPSRQRNLTTRKSSLNQSHKVIDAAVNRKILSTSRDTECHHPHPNHASRTETRPNTVNKAPKLLSVLRLQACNTVVSIVLSI